MSPKPKKTVLSDLITGCLCASFVLAAFIAEWYPLELIAYKMYDLEMRLRLKTAPPPVALIAIDAESIRKIGPWPWPRAYIALAINHLHDHGAKVIGVDVLYPERDVNPGLKEIRNVIQKIENEPGLRKQDGITEVFTALKEAEKKLDNDSILSASLARAKNVVLPLSFTLGSPGGGRSGTAEDYLGRNSLMSAGKDAVSARDATLPVRDFSESSMGLGHINHLADDDGTIRSEPLLISYADRLFPAFALQLIIGYLDRDISNVTVGKGGVRVGTLSIPTDKKHKMFVDFKRDEPCPRYSFSDLIGGKIPAGALKDRIVLLGCTAPGAVAPLKTPVSRSSYGVLISADAIGTILSRTPLVRPGWALPLESGVLVILGIVPAVIIPRFRIRISLLVVFILSSALVSAALLLFVLYGYWFKISYHIMLLGISCTGLLAKRLLFTRETEEPAGAEYIENGELKLVVGVRTDSGLLRESNEDNFCIEKESGLIAVADGVGGQASGEVASKMAIDAVRGYVRGTRGEHVPHNNNGEYSEDTNFLCDAVRFANKEIYEASHRNPLWQKMGTTIAAALMRKNRLSIVHAGDSRVYLVRAGQIEQLTDDHNLKESSTRHILTKALGICADIDVDLNELTLSGGDALVLCTDGLNTMISDSDILSAVGSTRDPARACASLIRMANKNGGKDNVTVIVAYAYRKK